MATKHDAQSVLRELGLVKITLRLHLRLFSEGLQNQWSPIFQEGGLSKNTVIDVIVFASVVGSSEVRLMSGELGILFAELSPDSIE